MTPPSGRAGSAESVRARLQDLSRKERVEFQLLLSEFGAERLLYRLGISPHADRYVLKGAMLFKLWSNERGRATWDLDMLGRGSNSVPEVVAVVRELCRITADDAILFNSESVRGEEIRAADEYAGVRVRLVASLAGARIPMQLDVGFGDAVTPAALPEYYPTLLDHEPPHVLVYPREAVVAEKLEAIVSLGVTNSRMKDFYDLQVLASAFSFDGVILSQAIRATFKRRGTRVPTELPVALTRAFLDAPERQTQWRAFLRRGRLAAAPDTAVLAASLAAFLGPPLRALADGATFAASWPAGGAWQLVRR